MSFWMNVTIRHLTIRASLESWLMNSCNSTTIGDTWTFVVFQLIARCQWELKFQNPGNHGRDHVEEQPAIISPGNPWFPVNFPLNAKISSIFGFFAHTLLLSRLRHLSKMPWGHGKNATWLSRGMGGTCSKLESNKHPYCLYKRIIYTYSFYMFWFPATLWWHSSASYVAGFVLKWCVYVTSVTPNPEGLSSFLFIFPIESCHFLWIQKVTHKTRHAWSMNETHPFFLTLLLLVDDLLATSFLRHLRSFSSKPSEISNFWAVLNQPLLVDDSVYGITLW